VLIFFIQASIQEVYGYAHEVGAEEPSLNENCQFFAKSSVKVIVFVELIHDNNFDALSLSLSTTTSHLFPVLFT
jgi:hypothetical protein